MRRLAIVFAVACGVGQAQQPIGTVGVQDATVSGALEVTNGRAILVGNTTVTAREHVADVALNRGGSVKVCATSGLHVTAGQISVGATGAMPLMLALDRGAVEVQMAATTSDVVMTPDLRFTMRGDGPLDLQLRVTKNGDTCVENRGAKAPVLEVAEQFGDATYELRPGQHVLFEHGSLKEVVDHESSSCGCPPDPPEPTMTVADALMKPGAIGGGGAAKTAAEEHPFPAAVSEGLAAPANVPQAPVGAVHAQVSATLSTDGPDSTTVPAPAGGTGTVSTSGDTASGATSVKTGDAAAGAVAAPTEAAATQTAPPRRGFAHAVGRFFKRLFGG